MLIIVKKKNWKIFNSKIWTSIENSRMSSTLYNHFIVGCGRHPRCFDWYDFGQSTWQVLFTNVKIMLRRYILSLGSREIAKCQKRLMSLDAVAPIGTAIEKDANYKVKNTCISNFLKLLWCRHCRVECAIVVCLNWLCNNNRPNIKNPIRLDLQSEWFKAICWDSKFISLRTFHECIR